MDVRLPCRVGVAVVAAIVAAGCSGDVAAPAKVESRVGFDLRSVMAHAALGSGASIAASVELVALLDGSPVLTVTQSIAPTDTMAVFDIVLEPATYTLVAVVYSNRQVPIFGATSPVTVGRAGFHLEMMMQPLAAVMVVSPRDTTVQFNPAGAPVEYSATVRNVGSQTLSWTATCDTPCQPRTSQGSVQPGGSSRATIVIPGTGTWLVTFDSAQGRVTVSVTVAA